MVEWLFSVLCNQKCVWLIHQINEFEVIYGLSQSVPKKEVETTLIILCHIKTSLHSPIHDAWYSSIGITESGDSNCGTTTALKPNIKPVLMVPMLATNAATICRNGLPRSGFCELPPMPASTVAPFGVVCTIFGIGFLSPTNAVVSCLWK